MGAQMRGIRALLLGCLIVSIATPALATSCSARKQVCFSYCDSQKYIDFCKRQCGDYEASCKATGCWEAPVTPKKCGFSKG